MFIEPRQEWLVPDVKDFFSENSEECLSDINLSQDYILKACVELKANSAAGADGVQAVILKTCRQELKIPLHLLWRSSMDSGIIPADLLLVLVSPVHKGGSRGAAKNYRPVALTSHIVKVFERVVRRSLVTHLERKGFLPDGQHGFRAMRSTLTQLLTYWDKMLDRLELGGGVDSVYLDFSKAFDKVEHGVLLHKLKDCQVSGRVGCWIAGFLNSQSRKQAVVVDGRVSELCPVLSGVPQGTVLGPVLFLVHIAGIADSLSAGTEASSFADDTRIMRSISSVAECEALQSDLVKVYRWADQVNMHFNTDKFECLRFWVRQGDAPDFKYLAPDSAEIKVKSLLRDLGVEISSDFSFKVHINKTVTSASRLAGWALRTFKRRGVTVMKTLWKCMIQPKLDHCSQLWCPDSQEAINNIEAVQRHFLARVSGLEVMHHWDWLQKMHLLSQERRRERYMIIFIWKIGEGLVKGYDVSFSESGRRGRVAIPRPIISSAPAIIKRAREASLGVKGCKLFNLLPDSIRNMKVNTVDQFKAALDRFLSTVPDQPTIVGSSRGAETNSLLHQLYMRA